MIHILYLISIVRLPFVSTRGPLLAMVRLEAQREQRRLQRLVLPRHEAAHEGDLET